MVVDCQFILLLSEKYFKKFFEIHLVFFCGQDMVLKFLYKLEKKKWTLLVLGKMFYKYQSWLILLFGIFVLQIIVSLLRKGSKIPKYNCFLCLSLSFFSCVHIIRMVYSQLNWPIYYEAHLFIQSNVLSLEIYFGSIIAIPHFFGIYFQV